MVQPPQTDAEGDTPDGIHNPYFVDATKPSSTGKKLPSSSSIILFIAPPAGIVFTELIITITVLLGCALSWAWGVITLEAAVARHASARGGKHHKSATICRGPDSQWIHVGYECDHHVFLHDGTVRLLYGKLHDPSSY